MSDSNNAVSTEPASQPGPKRVPVTQALNVIRQLYSAGHLEQAEAACAQIAEQRPRLADAHNLLGVILNARGKPREAVKALQRALHLSPDTAQYLCNLGEIERQRGKLAEAQNALNRALSINPDDAQALNNLGIVHFDKREFGQAARYYEEAIKRNANYPEAHNNLGNALRMLNRQDEAIGQYQKALLQRQNYAEAYNNMASVLQERQQMEEAEFAYRRAFAINPRYIEPYNNLAVMLASVGRADEALRVLAEALRIAPNHVQVLVSVARIQIEKGNVAQAEQACRMALQSDPQNADAMAALGQVLHETDRFSEALAQFESAIKLKPALVDVRNYYGVALKSVGRMDDAREQFLKVIEQNPLALGAYANLGDLIKYSPDHRLLASMQDILSRTKDPDSLALVPLYFALGKAQDDVGEHEKALQSYLQGAKLKRKLLAYDEAATLRFMDEIKTFFPRTLFQDRPFKGHASERPIFIVGMPRSGSTLVEQILSSHPDTFGAGEIKTLSRVLANLRSRLPSLPKYPMMMQKLEPPHYKMVAEGYIKYIEDVSAGALRTTDKLLTNYYFVGLINLLFPNAKIIHTKRNPVDTCLSAFTKLFKDDMPHSYDLGELGRYYRKYEELMQHWKEVLPDGVMTEIVYEDVVSDVEGMARKLVAFVGLPWSDQCVDFHESDRPVKTASVVQVRQPVYKTSVERWRRYGDKLQPLLDALHYETN